MADQHKQHHAPISILKLTASGCFRESQNGIHYKKDGQWRFVDWLEAAVAAKIANIKGNQQLWKNHEET